MTTFRKLIIIFKNSKLHTNVQQPLNHPIQNSTQQPFISIHTLNNRALWINLKKIKGIAILDDNADAPDQDWDLTWDGYQGHSIEIYRALEHYYYDNLKNYSKDYSENFQKEIQTLIQEYDLHREGLLDEIFQTHIYSVGGSKESFYVDAEYLWNIESYIGCGDNFENHFLNLSFSEMSRFKNISQITVISAPLHSIMEEASKEMAMLENMVN